MPLPVLSVAQVREWENATWAAGRSKQEVIANVGRCLAARALRLTRAGDRILLLAGAGHNGDDARAARTHLAQREVELCDVLDPARDIGRVKAALARKPALVLDGLFGIGLNRPLSSEWIALIDAVNGSRAPVLAVDVPSGLDADTGRTYGSTVRAWITLTVGVPKAGLLRQPAWDCAGRVEVAPDIGLLPCDIKTELQWALPADFEGFPPRRQAASHKGSFGHLAIVAGSHGFHGAAVLAARGAQRAQPGLITLHTTESAYLPAASQLQAVMVRLCEPKRKLEGPWSAILVGPGLAGAEIPNSVRDLTRQLWCDSLLPMVVDASALDWLPDEGGPKNSLRVITPHPGEASRLLGVASAQVQADRPAALSALSAKFGSCWVVLKGHQTLVGRAGGPVSVNSSGNPHLAQGGSGDVLSGYLAGLLAQRTLAADAFLTLRYAVWQHGATADSLQTSRRSWTIEDLVEAIGSAAPEENS